MRYDRQKHAARHTDEYVFHQLLPYLGSKRHLLDLIGAALDATGLRAEQATFVDAFAGSGVVSRFAKRRGFAVVSNDWEPYAEVCNTAAIASERPPACAPLGGYEAAIARLNALPGEPGWVTEHLCPADDAAPDPHRERLFYRRATGRRIDAIRARIAAWRADGAIDADGAACLLAPLLYQACWLANTSGVFKGFHRGWGGSNGTALHRILADLQLSPQRFLATGRDHRVLAVDALHLAAHLGGTPDVVYVDPPYNQHPYASNYHVLNSLVVWDRPALPPPTERGWRAAIRPDWRQRRSPFNDRRAAASAFAQLLDRLDAPHLLLSYSTDGTIPLERLVALAAGHGALRAFCRGYKRYRTSPTRPSPRPRTVEFVLAIDRRQRAGDGGAAALAAIHAETAAVSAAASAAAPGAG
ncbi:MAG: DNA adenine methylase [Planctomycetes bacterium]|nr:DNA adenine methylase [Planctomycetota bacterium]